MEPPTGRASLLFVDPVASERHLPSLRARFEVTSVDSADQALRALRTFEPHVVVIDLGLPDGASLKVCRESKAAARSTLVLGTTDRPQLAAEALAAGCDGVLVKPFAPNLLHARLGLLQRRGTMSVDHERCPACARGGVVNFDFAGARRSWYACVPCRKVWMGPEARVSA